jgi:DNA gyrase subunit A
MPGSVPNDADAVVTQMLLTEELLEQDMVLVTQKGKIKRAPLQEFTNLTGRGLTAMKVKKGDELAYVTLANLGEELVLGTSGGRLLRFLINDDNLPVMGRAAQGPQGLRMGKHDTIVGVVSVLSGQDCVLMVSAAGYAKRMPVDALRMGHRGDIGTQCFQFSQKKDHLVTLAPAIVHTNITLLTSGDRIASVSMDAIPRQGRTGECDRILKPGRGETITQVVSVISPEDNTGKSKPSSEEE